MNIESIVEGCPRKNPREMVILVEAAFESNGINPMMESQMVDGILALNEWKKENS